MSRQWRRLFDQDDAKRGARDADELLAGEAIACAGPLERPQELGPDHDHEVGELRMLTEEVPEPRMGQPVGTDPAHPDGDGIIGRNGRVVVEHELPAHRTVSYTHLTLPTIY